MSAVLDAVIPATAIVGAAAFTAGSAVIWRSGRRIKQMTEDWNGEPARPGVPERLGVMVRLERIESTQGEQGQQIQQIWHEVHPNSGASMRDDVTHIREAIASRAASS